MTTKKNKNKNILDEINFPEDFRKLSRDKLPQLSDELRKFLIESVSQTGGHFGSNLGVVELTVALHYVFDTPRDRLIWDVGHQAYPHKILTGRKNRMNTIRKKGGLAPFPKKEESEYDAFSVGHSSTSIGAAAGMALANKENPDAPQIVAVIGDGAISAGMAFEALNHAGTAKADMLVILNDNKMSISPNRGGMEEYLTRLISSPSYIKFRDRGREILGSVPSLKKFIMRAESHTKGMVTPGTLFEELGFEYFGPIDGHDVGTLVEVLENLKRIRGPKLLHILTKKGKGYGPAEQDRCFFHAVKPFDPVTGKNKKDSHKTSFTDVFSSWICDRAEQDERLQAITPAMCDGSGLLEFSRRYPGRYHDVSIAEQHAVTLAAGLASQGKKPVVAIYSSFLQRAYDQLIHDVAYQKADVLFAVDRAGIVGPDGPTHAGSFDLSFLRIVPNLVIMAPAEESECYSMLEAGYRHEGPAVVRYPRGSGTGVFSNDPDKIKIGQAREVRTGRDVAILSFGTLLDNCRKVADELGATLINMRFIKPLDEELLTRLMAEHRLMITVEDNVKAGGAGSAVDEFLSEAGFAGRVLNLGLPDEFLGHGTREEILADVGLDEKGIAGAIKKVLADSLQPIVS